jgi:tRNA (guanosine-2'-O-)-methyltransferase
VRLALLLLCLAVACGGPPAKTPSGSTVTAKNLAGPKGVELVMACTPTGPELCFNAIDDNCNGVLDEGCGVATGLLQFVIAWGDSPADLDLVMTGPNQEKVGQQVNATPGGFRRDHDCPRDECQGQNIENIFFDGLEPPKGKYTVEVRLEDSHGADVPVKVRFGARVGSRTFGADLFFAKAGEKKTFTFEL